MKKTNQGDLNLDQLLTGLYLTGRVPAMLYVHTDECQV
jgi:hypothetical protein